MPAGPPYIERIPCYCALCVSRCGAIAVVEDGRFVALEPDPAHPTGKAICAKGRAAPELVDHAERLLYPLKRTRPKGDADPGWQRISWDDALDITAQNLKRIAAAHGPESVAFAFSSPSTSASSDSLVWMERLMRAFGSPNLCGAMELCGWGRYLATMFTYGTSVPGVYMPDLERAGCILFWGYNPNLARLVHAVDATAALRRGARMIVVDPRRTGPASKADIWLRVRPGTDGALALGIAHVMIERNWYDRDFIRDWTNAPLLVRNDNGRLLTEHDINGSTAAKRFVAWNEQTQRAVLYDPATGKYDADNADLALFGAYKIATSQGNVVCQTVFDLTAQMCAQYTPERVFEICGVPGEQVEQTAQLLWEARPVAYYAWSGVEMQTGATQIARAIAQLYALTGNFDSPGGNVLFAGVPSPNVAGEDLLSARAAAARAGLHGAAARSGRVAARHVG